MDIIQKIEKDLREAFKNKTEDILSVLRLVKAAFQNREIELRSTKGEFNENEAINILKKEVKKRRDSITAFLAGGRQDLVDKEQKELEILSRYLPEQMSEEQIKIIVVKVISEIGEVSERDFGKIMKNVITETQGQADGTVVSKIVKEALASK